ncbi:MAG: mechanosensitive ion channel family protein, partial [Deltaproteobacteria bacterium]|nr:mechanosensitive ion channel family protein [Deltaproteobacteria bacterium]
MEFDFSSFVSPAMPAEAAWVIKPFLVIFSALVLSWVVKKLLARLERNLVSHTQTVWDEALVGAVQKPVSVLIWVLAITFAAEMAREVADTPAFQYITPLRQLGVIVALTLFFLNLAKNGEAAYVAGQKQKTEQGEREGGVDEATVATLGKLLRISIYVTSGLVVMQTLGFSISGLLAFGGVGGIAVGFAAKDLLSNLFGGLMVFLDRPFTIGDWINMPAIHVEGTVEHISWRTTRIRTFQKRLIYVPNATFSNIPVENPSRM